MSREDPRPMRSNVSAGPHSLRIRKNHHYAGHIATDPAVSMRDPFRRKSRVFGCGISPARRTSKSGSICGAVRLRGRNWACATGTQAILLVSSWTRSGGGPRRCGLRTWSGHPLPPTPQSAR